MAYCEGKFPEFMLDAWDEYDYRKDSDNDRPGGAGKTLLCSQNFISFSLSLSPTPPLPLLSDVFGPNQQYIAFLLENSGMQLGSYVVSTPISYLTTPAV